MRITAEEKAKNRARILETASRLFRERGVENVGLATLMSEAGFTHGGFYNHFDSKEALVAEVCEAGAAATLRDLAAALSGEDADAAWRRTVEGYLSPAHRDDPARGCAIAALMGDAAREPADVQASLARGNDELLGILARYLARRYRLDADAARRRAIERWSQIVGAIALSRAVVRADRALADEILRACRERLTR